MPDILRLLNQLTQYHVWHAEQGRKLVRVTKFAV